MLLTGLRSTRSSVRSSATRTPNVLMSDLSSLEAQELVTKDFLSRARYEEPSDPALARWHDGTQFTEHTVVTADW
jgi:hypothetical protein